MEELQRLRQQYSLSPDKITAISKIIIFLHTLGVTGVDKPIAIILGGQPGSGKSELTTQAQLMLGKNAVICNADDYRDYHPKSDEIKKKHEAYYPEITVEYSQPWNNQLKAHCEANKLNFILETTFSSGEVMNDTIKDLKRKGYRVYILVLAVNSRLSFLGTRLRFEEMKALHGYGRSVVRAIHDQKYMQVADTLKVVQKSKLYDKLIVFGRAGRQKVKGMHNGLVKISENGTSPLNDYLTERDKEWSDNDNRFFNDDILYLIRLMIARRASYEELEEVLNVFKVGHREE